MPRPKRRLADIKRLAAYVDTSIQTVRRQVQSGRLPAPFYPSPGCARWDLDEVDQALAATRRPRAEGPAEAPLAMAS